MLARSSALTCTACAVTCAPRMRARTPFCMSATPTEAPMAAEAPCVVEMPSAPVAVTMRLLSWAETETRPASARSCAGGRAAVVDDRLHFGARQVHADGARAAQGLAARAGHGDAEHAVGQAVALRQRADVQRNHAAAAVELVDHLAQRDAARARWIAPSWMASAALMTFWPSTRPVAWL